MKPEVFFALDHAAWPALLVDGAGAIRKANPAAVSLFGTALEGAPPLLAAIWSPENGNSAEQFLAHWERNPAAVLTLKYHGKGGNTMFFPTSICSLQRDEQKYFLFQLLPESAGRGAPEAKNHVSEASAAQKQKLECALQLARTVSLDFNNALTVVLGHTSLVLGQMEADHPWRLSLVQVEKSAAKAAEIANDLGTFSRQDKEVRVQAAGNLNTLVERTLEAFQNTQSAKIGWAFHPERRLYAAKFDEAKLQQALIKVLENAAEAVNGDGRITIQSRNLDLAASTQDRNVRLAPGHYVCVEISDNGAGITPEVLPRIFEPFFTTKGGGQHRGLGLAWVYGIITNHGGGVAVSSQVNVGTSVRVYLPAEKNVIAENPLSADDLKGDQSVLVVDDEDVLGTMVQTILWAYGYRIETANSGARALELLGEGGKQFDLMITDLVMPGVSGRELVERVRRLSPGTRIICMSGYALPTGKEEEALYLQKPFTCRELLLKVKRTLAPVEATRVD